MQSRILFRLVVLIAGTLFLVSNPVVSQYTITGASYTNQCVFGGKTYPYIVSTYDPGGNQKWCVTGGTINGTSNTCVSNTTGPVVNITWSSGASTGTISYYRPASSSTPLATFTVTLIPPTFYGNSPDYYFPYIPAGVNVTMPLIGSDGSTCSPNVYYRWENGTDGINFTAIPGATNKDYLISGTFTQNIHYRRYISFYSPGYNETYTQMTIFAAPPPTPGTVTPAATTVISNTSPGTLTAAAATPPPNGGMCSGNPNYTWQSSTDKNTWTNLGTGLSYTPGALTQTTWFRQRIQCGPVVIYGNPVPIYVLKPGTIDATSTNISYNTSPGQLNEILPPTGIEQCTNTYTYQWQTSPANDNYTDIPGAMGMNYDPGNLTTSTRFRRAVTCGSHTVYSNVIHVNVHPQLFPGTLTANPPDVGRNESPGSTISGTLPSGGNCGANNWAYAWQKSIDGTTWENIPDASGISYASYVTGPLSVKTWFRRKVNCAIQNVYSDPVVVNVTKGLDPGEITPAVYEVPYNSSPGQITANPASGGCGSGYVYQWEMSTDAGMNYQPICNGAVLSCPIDNVTSSIWIRRKVTCGAQVAYTRVCRIIAGASLNTNYIRTRTITKPAVPDLASANALTALKDVKQTTAFFDGLGRPLQTVIKQGSLTANGNATDLVSFQTYDEFGREASSFLPFASNSNDGEFKLNMLQEATSFGNTHFGPQGENMFYGQILYENSPLKRITNRMVAGNSWIGSNRSLKTKYYINTDIDAVRVWNVTDGPTGSFGSYTSPDYYPAGRLYKEIVVDEHGKQLITFRDINNRVILKKVQLQAVADDGSGSGHANWLCTYYIHDDIGNLRCVIQPRGVELIAPAWQLNDATILAEQCFRYEYDQRGKMIMKKVPGAEPLQMVYDARDRVVMTQDANMGTSSQMQWLVTQYDELNRVVATYKITDPANYNNPGWHRQQAENSIAYPNVGAYTNELLSETHYDNYNGIPAVFSTSTLYASNYGQYMDAAATDYPEPSTLMTSHSNLITWTKTKVLGENKYITTCNLYDEKGRVIQNQTLNYTGAMDITTKQYNFSGLELRSHIKHQKGGAPVQSVELATKNNFDDLGRIKGIEKNLNNGGWKPVAFMSYDALGHLKTQKLSPAFDNNNGLETLTYDYNIRGWTLGVNRDYANSTTGTDHYFGFDLGYDKQTIASLGNYTAAQYNGNIAGTVWKSRGDGQLRKYDFAYDAVNRLTKADFTQYNGGFNINDGIDFSVSNLTYDANGNIITQTQKGLKVAGSNYIDQLTYNYFPNTNRLQNVSDLSNDPQTQLGDFRYSPTYQSTLNGPKAVNAVDYGYDVNGNMTSDKNKDIVSITYNHLNLPQTITLTNNRSISYTYDANGIKWKKLVQEAGQPDKSTLYLFGNYENDALQFLPMEEGRIRPVRDGNGVITSFTYDYFVKDHLGNVRMVLTEEEKQETYPAATLEGDFNNSGSAVYIEKTFYNINEGNIVDKSTAWEITDYENNNGNPPYNTNPNSNTDGLSTKLYQLNGSYGTGNMGLSVTLKVMAGDKINIFGKSYYYQPGKVMHRMDFPLVAIDILNMFVTGKPLQGKGISGSGLSSDVPGLATTLNNFLHNRPDGGISKPGAYINWVIFDEQFHYVSGGFDAVGDANFVKTHDNSTISTIEIPKNGYIFVYCNNTTMTQTVFFDNLQVIHTHSPILEETHYYPFGLTLAGISSKALNFGAPENKRKYNGIEYENSFDLNIGETFFRTHDPQLGRWWQIDPKPTVMISPYAAMKNNPILLSDPLGDTTWAYNQNGVLLGVIPDKLKNQVHFLKTEGDPGQQVNTKGLSKKELNALGKSFRQNSFAFIGNNTVSEMQKLAQKAESLGPGAFGMMGKELTFVGTVGPDKQIHLTALAIDDRNKQNNDAGEAKINEAYPDAQSQSNLVLWGHIHPTHGDTSPNPQGAFGTPSPGADYGNFLYRNGANQKGPSPAIIGTVYGITVYGSKEDYSNNSYILYKSLK